MSNEKEPYKKELTAQLGEAGWFTSRCLHALADLEDQLQVHIIPLDHPGGEAIQQANDWLSNCISLYERNLKLIRAMYLDSGPPKVEAPPKVEDSNRYSIEDIEKCVENWGLCKVEKEHIEKFLTREWLERQPWAALNFPKKTAEAERPQPPVPVTQWWENLVHGDENWDRALEKYQALVPHLLNNGGHRDPTPTEQSFLDAYHKAQTTRIQRCLLYTSPSPRDGLLSRMPSSA